MRQQHPGSQTISGCCRCARQQLNNRAPAASRRSARNHTFTASRAASGKELFGAGRENPACAGQHGLVCLEARDEHCSDGIWISLYFLVGGCFAHCRAGKLVLGGRDAFSCSRQECGSSWPKTGWGRVHQAAGGLLWARWPGGCRGRGSPCKALGSFNSKEKGSREKKKRQRNLKEKKPENRKGVEYENKAWACFVSALFGKRELWLQWCSRSARCGDLPCPLGAAEPFHWTKGENQGKQPRREKHEGGREALKQRAGRRPAGACLASALHRDTQKSHRCGHTGVTVMYRAGTFPGWCCLHDL